MQVFGGWQCVSHQAHDACCVVPIRAYHMVLIPDGNRDIKHTVTIIRMKEYFDPVEEGRFL